MQGHLAPWAGAGSGRDSTPSPPLLLGRHTASHLGELAETWEPVDPAAEGETDDPEESDVGWEATEPTEVRKPLEPARAWKPDGLA
jgi:hypothetical protein